MTVRKLPLASWQSDYLLPVQSASSVDALQVAASQLYSAVRKIQSEDQALEVTDPELAVIILDALKAIPLSLCNSRTISILYQIEGLIIDLHSLYREDQSDAFYLLGRLRKKRLLEIVGRLPFESRQDVLDLGCADGTYLLDLKKVCTNVMGVDVSDERLERIRRKDSSVSLMKVDLNEEPIPLRDASLSLVFATEVLEHIVSEAFVFSEISRCLRPGGVLVASIPNRKSMARRIELIRVGPVNHSTWYHPNDWSLEDVQLRLRKSKLRLVQSFGVGLYIPKVPSLLGNRTFQGWVSRREVLGTLCEDLIVIAEKQ